jgi:hypothetical protein
MKTAVLITIGDEILSGNTVDTNSNFIATQLKEIGIKVLSILQFRMRKGDCFNFRKALKWLMWFYNRRIGTNQRRYYQKLMPISSKMK